MTSDLWCLPHVHLIVIDEDVIVLDLESDHYDCLVDAASWLASGDDGRILVPNQAAAAALQDARIATDTPPPPRPLRSRPEREIAVLPDPSGSEVLRALLHLAAATAIFRGKPLLELVRFAAAPPSSSSPTASPERDAVADGDIAVLVSAARHARPWVPFEGECLQRAFQLRYYLAHRGIRTDWVFGVRTWPFSAHCWLQIGGLVVGDRLERVARYTPIMTA
ncbi:hypothetical protein D3C72_475730 [compost metagenome]